MANLKLPESGKLFHTLIILSEKKYTLTLLHLGLYKLYACPLVFETEENSKKSPDFNFTSRKTITSKLSRAVDDVINDLEDQV